MKIIYLGIGYPTKGDQNIYTDLMQEFLKNDHSVTVLCCDEAVEEIGASRGEEDGIDVIRVRTGNVYGKVSLIRKGISTLTVDRHFLKAARKYIATEKFDLILCSTPPITLIATLKYLKKINKASVYLMLKDIFPQNAVDIGMMRKDPFIYGYFRHKEKVLYSICDYIGCMSEGNLRYLLEHNPEIPKTKVGLCVNSLNELPSTPIDIEQIRHKFGIATDKIIFLYGGNLGKPQGIDNLCSFLDTQKGKNDRLYLICGKGKEAYKIERYIQTEAPNNVLYIDWIPYAEFDLLASACDVGMIFLDPRFTIPNFPSRMISLMRCGLPIFAATDTVTDICEIIRTNDIGWWGRSNNTAELSSLADEICIEKRNLKDKGEKSRRCFLNNYTCEVTCRQILSHEGTHE